MLVWLSKWVPLPLKYDLDQCFRTGYVSWFFAKHRTVY